MRIAVDARRIMNNMSGLGIYTSLLVRALADRFGDEDLRFYMLPRSLRPEMDLPAHLIREVPYPVEDHFRGEWWKHVTLPAELRTDNVQVFHDPAFQLPLRNVAGARVVTIMDLAPFKYPETNTLKYNTYWKFITRQAMRRAHRVIAPSDYIRRELVEYFHVPESLIVTTHLAASREFKPGDVQPEILEKYGIPPKYMVTVATFEPRKNLAGLVDALDRLATAHPDAGYHLVAVGNPGWKNNAAAAAIRARGLTGKVTFTGYVPQADLETILRGAVLVVVPSVYEGFGFPVLEGMACGTPVAASRAASLPEVGGDAVRYFDPANPEDMAMAIAEIWTQPGARSRMTEEGFRQCRRFSWADTADGTMAAYRDAWEIWKRERR